ncbi:MAG: hypothetical protein J6W64_02125 [Bacilli bacterium]|nr:hypothetical protein [Bacilli bacterium]
MKKIILSILIISFVVVLTGCGKESKKEVVETKKIESELGTKEVSETISKTNNMVEYEFETESVKVVTSMKHNKKFKYTDGKIEKGDYTISMELVETYLPMFEQYKELAGYESLTIDGKEALKTNSELGQTILVKISNEAILYIKGTTNGRIVNHEMTEDKDYKNVIKSIKIKVTEK